MTELLIYAPQLEKSNSFPSIPIKLSFREFQTLCLLVLEGVNKRVAFDSRDMQLDEFAVVCAKLSEVVRQSRLEDGPVTLTVSR